ncbi:hypothetical protein ACFYXL_19825 [Streptomyces tsukubensis]|uniref:hypothetical protein n=1 Tax=Streptomyces tsukubensis TaxID=83656 RepID=UPI0036BF88D0
MGQSVPPPVPPDPDDRIPETPAGPPEPRRHRDSLAAGLAAAVAAGLLGAVAYGWLAEAVNRQFGYASLGVGALIGYAAAKAGGAHRALPFAAAALTPAAIWLGQLITVALIHADLFRVSATELLFEESGFVTETWRDSADLGTYTFMIVGMMMAAYTAWAKRPERDDPPEQPDHRD